ncbi:hypothetical protein C8A01DRAFT_12199 [Parachaetomium inaequale]|uniref:BHLH domain-containing protein n=1 Tax=Parachaetomium inaequale TaxID=2588326 RepID=A0AAN6PSB6_9PEZI|nr:hypothetical protein C8A01DRAFT_12199 [Parachaetomium inaequale]
MNHDHVWSANGPSQLLDELHDGMLPSGLIAQPLADSQPGPWTSGQESGCASPFNGLFVHTQHQGQIHACGLPSPAPTAPAASPPNWPNHDASSVTGPWAPVSPISPTVGEGVGGGPNTQLLYAPNTAAPVTFDTGFHDWTGNTGFPLNFNYEFSGGPAPVPQGVPADFSTAWPGPIPAEDLSNGPFLETVFGHALPTRETTGLWHALPSIPQPHPYPPSKCPASRSQQQHQPPKRTKASSSFTTPSDRRATIPPPPPPATTPTTTGQNPSRKPPSSTAAAAAAPAGPSLRTAARRVKRPAPSPKPGESPAHQRARTNHNLVEQQYRHRLHARFEALLDVLPEGILDGDEDDGNYHWGVGKRRGGGSGSGGGVAGKKTNRRMSKVDVLSKAERVIRFLEGDIERIRREMEGMRRERETAFGGVGRVEGGEEGAVARR